MKSIIKSLLLIVIMASPTAWAETFCADDGRCVELTQQEPDAYDNFLEFANQLAMPVEIPTVDGGSIWVTPEYTRPSWLERQ